MIIETFKVEQWMNEYENDAIYNLAETCVDSLGLRELLKLCGEEPEAYAQSLLDIRFTYSHIYGSPEFKKGVADLYKNIEPNQVMPTHGAIGANHMVLSALVNTGDTVVAVKPTYQQHYSIPESIGAEVKILSLSKENGFLPDIEQLRRHVDDKTKLIGINNPNNPSGALIPDKMLREIVQIAAEAGAYILCDEVYKGLSPSGEYMTSIVDLYEKGISVGSMSKVYSLAGLRMGWIATRNEEVHRLCSEYRDYSTISCGVFDDKIAALALKNKDAILARNCAIASKNLEILDRWVEQEPLVSYVKPQAGTTALLYYKLDMSSRELCRELLAETGVFFTPGECFDLEGCVRIGYTFDSKTLETGLSRFSEFLRKRA